MKTKRDIEQEIYDVILEQVHLIDVENPLVGRRQNPPRKVAFAVFESALQIDGSDQLVLGNAEGKRLERRAAKLALDVLTLSALVTPRLGPRERATVGAPVVDRDARQ